MRPNVDGATHAESPIVYAPRPICLELISQGSVPIYGYTTGVGISSAPTRELAFTAVDIDLWMRTYLVAIDDMLSPEFLTAAEVIGAGTTDYSAQLLDAKGTIAASLKQLVMAVLSPQQTTEDLTAAQDAMEQQLLLRLGNFYDTRTDRSTWSSTADRPRVLRTCPTPPTLVSQSFERGADPTDSGHAPPLAELLEWVFSFEYQADFHAAQDQTCCTINFNSSEAASGFDPFENRLSAEDEGVFIALAQFVTVFPDVEKDLLSPASSATARPLDEARIALESVIKLITGVSSVLTGEPLTVRSPPAKHGSFDYGIYVQESATEVDDNGAEVDARLLVSLYEIDARPAGVGEPLVGISGYTANRVTDRPPGAHAAWTYSNDDGPLPPGDGAAIARRQVSIPGLNVIDKQDALASAFVTRNRNLVPGVETAEEFWYTSSEVAFAAPLRPLLDRSDSINIASLESSTAVARSLVDQLQHMFAQLFAVAPSGGQPVRLEVRYEYLVQDDLFVSLPVMLASPFELEAVDGTSQSLADGITRWFAGSAPPTAGGRLGFGLTVFSRASPTTLLLRLSNLVLPLESIEPPLESVSSREVNRSD